VSIKDYDFIMTPYVSINSYAPKLVPMVYYRVKSRVQMFFFLILVLDIHYFINYFSSLSTIIEGALYLHHSIQNINL